MSSPDNNADDRGAALAADSNFHLSDDALVETLLFVAEGPVEIGRIARVLQVDRSRAEQAIAKLADHYRGRGVRLQQRGDAVLLVSAPESAECVERFLGIADSNRLSGAALETLAIIAYRQPVTRTQVESIRGVNADYAIRTLLARRLVEEVGRLETVGRPIVLGTTFEFLQYFGLESLDQLPPLPETLVAMAEARAAGAPAGESMPAAFDEQTASVEE